MSRFHRLISVLLLTLCLQWIVPPDLVHSFCNHTDSIDCCHAEGDLVFSVQHHHCLVLEISLPPLWHEVQDVKYVDTPNIYFHQHFLLSHIRFVQVPVFEGRGPPVNS
jgi:hypothetical protein